MSPSAIQLNWNKNDDIAGDVCRRHSSLGVYISRSPATPKITHSVTPGLDQSIILLLASGPEESVLLRATDNF